MASGKEVKNRMKSVANIRKITKSMKMVAASRLRGAQNRMEQARPFGQSIADVFEPVAGEAPAGTHLLVCITSDRGLCGGINAVVVKNTKILLRELAEENKDAAVIILGDKGRPMLQREFSDKITMSTSELWKKPLSYSAASLLAEEILKKNFSKVSVIYNRFRSVISYDLTNRTFDAPSVIESDPAYLNQYELDDEDDKTGIMRDLYEFNLANTIYSALLENASSEQAARMSAMDNATRNAGDMLQKLQLFYNRSRQAQITTELIEIISGAESLKG